MQPRRSRISRPGNSAPDPGMFGRSPLPATASPPRHDVDRKGVGAMPGVACFIMGRSGQNAAGPRASPVRLAPEAPRRGSRRSRPCGCSRHGPAGGGVGVGQMPLCGQRLVERGPRKRHSEGRHRRFPRTRRKRRDAAAAGDSPPPAHRSAEKPSDEAFSLAGAARGLRISCRKFAGGVEVLDRAAMGD